MTVGRTHTTLLPLKQMAEELLQFVQHSALWNIKPASKDVLILQDIDPAENNFVLAQHQLSVDSNARLEKMLDKSNRNKQERGVQSLYLFSHQIEHVDNKNNLSLSSPIFLLPIQVEKKKGIEPSYLVSKETSEWLINPLLVKSFKERYDLVLPELATLHSMPEILEILKPYGHLADTFGLGIFPIKDQAIYEDIQRIETYNESLAFLFGEEPQPVLKPIDEITRTSFALIAAADDSQLKAIQTCMQEKYLRIEGPPGTGKSQTITNLIAQLLAANQKVLVVSDKKIALDVLYQSLEEKGLDAFAALVHDIHEDKLGFYTSMEQTYKTALQYQTRNTDDSLYQQYKLHQRLQDHYDKAKTAVLPEIGYAYEQLLSLDRAQDVSFDIQFVKPNQWTSDKIYLKEIVSRIFTQGYGNKIADTCIAHLNIAAIDSHHIAPDFLASLLERMAFFRAEFKGIDRLEELYQVSIKASLLQEFIENNELFLFDKKASVAKKLLGLIRRLENLRQEALAFEPFLKAWKTPLKEEEILTLIDSVTSYTKNASPETIDRYQTIKSFIEKNFDSSGYAIKPSPKVISKKWQDYLSQAAEQRELLQNIESIYPFEKAHHTLYRIQYISSKLNQGDRVLQDMVNGSYTIALLQKALHYKKDIGDLHDALCSLFWGKGRHEFDWYKREIQALLEVQPLLNGIVPFFAFLRLVEETTWKAYTNIAYYGFDGFEQKVYQQAFLFLEHKFPILKSTGREQFTFSRTFVKQNADAAFRHEAKIILDQLYASTHQVLIPSDATHNMLQASEKEKKKTLLAARKLLEHEFAKKQQKLSLRTLIHELPAHILFSLKRVWFTSPSTIPSLFSSDPDLFDCLIIDESSRVKLPESIPGIWRAKKIIIVGDEQQLPPSNFFASKQESDHYRYDSVLHKAVERYPGIMLRYHYRSKYQDLIQFSNQYFYKNQLLIQAKTSGGLLHQYVEGGVFQDGRNEKEAEAMIEYLVTHIIPQKEKSVGIACFSLEQAMCIQMTLQKHRKRNMLLNSYLQEQEHVSAPFFIKNLENIQGDERDIMLIGIGYGYSPEGTFRQHFGPLNHAGGEKRLNVLITRAKEKMVVFSSIHAYDITQEENAGVVVLKRFLDYCENREILQ